MFKAMKKMCSTVFNTTTTAFEVVDIALGATKDLTQAMKHTTAAYEIEVELFKQKRIDILTQYKNGEIEHDEALKQIQNLNQLIKELEAANEADED